MRPFPLRKRRLPARSGRSREFGSTSGDSASFTGCRPEVSQAEQITPSRI